MRWTEEQRRRRQLEKCYTVPQRELAPDCCTHGWDLTKITAASFIQFKKKAERGERSPSTSRSRQKLTFLHCQRLLHRSVRENHMREMFTEQKKAEWCHPWCSLHSSITSLSCSTQQQHHEQLLVESVRMYSQRSSWSPMTIKKAMQVPKV